MSLLSFQSFLIFLHLGSIWVTRESQQVAYKTSSHQGPAKNSSHLCSSKSSHCRQTQWCGQTWQEMGGIVQSLQFLCNFYIINCGNLGVGVGTYSGTEQYGYAYQSRFCCIQHCNCIFGPRIRFQLPTWSWWSTTSLLVKVKYWWHEPLNPE